MAVASGRQRVASETQYRKWLGAQRETRTDALGTRAGDGANFRGWRGCKKRRLVCTRACTACTHGVGGLVGEELLQKLAWGNGSWQGTKTQHKGVVRKSQGVNPRIVAMGGASWNRGNCIYGDLLYEALLTHIILTVIFFLIFMYLFGYTRS